MEHFSFSRDLLRFFLFRGNGAQEMRGRLTRLYGRSDIVEHTQSITILKGPSSPGNPIFLIFSSNSWMSISVSVLIFNLTKLRRRPSYSSLNISNKLRKIRDRKYFIKLCKACFLLKKNLFQGIEVVHLDRYCKLKETKIITRNF